MCCLKCGKPIDHKDGVGGIYIQDSRQTLSGGHIPHGSIRCYHETCYAVILDEPKFFWLNGWVDSNGPVPFR